MTIKDIITRAKHVILKFHSLKKYSNKILFENTRETDFFVFWSMLFEEQTRVRDIRMYTHANMLREQEPRRLGDKNTIQFDEKNSSDSRAPVWHCTI